MKTYRFLRRETVTAEQVRERFAKKAAIDLLRARHNPDHSSAAVAALEAVLHERGIGESEIGAFLKEPEEYYAMPLCRPPSVKAALRWPKLWRWLRLSMWVAFVICVAGFSITLPKEEAADQERVNQLISEGAIDEAAYQEFLESHGNSRTVNETVLKELGIHSGPRYSVLFVMVAMVVIVPGLRGLAWFWPSRILLLRPFGAPKVSKALKRFVGRNVSHCGHVMTLADQHMKESSLMHLWETMPKSPEEIFLRVLFWVRLIDDPRRRLYIKKAAHYRMLRRRLGSRFTWNLFWVTSFDTIRKIRTTDPWWRRCIDLLTANCEVVLVDLSVVKAGTQWELSKIQREGLERKCMFIAQEDRIEEAQKILSEYWPEEATRTIHVYDERGRLANVEGFKLQLASIQALPRPSYAGRPRSDFWYWMTLFFGWTAFLGLLLSLNLLSRARRSDGRLRGLHVAKVMGVLSMVLTALMAWQIATLSPSVVQADEAVGSSVREDSGESGMTASRVTPFVYEAPDAGYRVTAQEGWREYPDEAFPSGGLFAYGSFGEVVAAVVVQDADVLTGTPDDVVEIIRFAFELNGASDVVARDVVVREHDGVQWIEFRMNAMFDEVAFAYLCWVHVGSKFSHRVLVWTSGESFSVQEARMREFFAGVQLLEPSASGDGVEEEEEVYGPLTFDGRLREGLNQLPQGEWFENYLFAGLAGDRVTIDLRSTDFDTYLIVNSPSELGWNNDDWGENPGHSRIELIFPESGEYLVTVTSYEPGETGEYTLEISGKRAGEAGQSDSE